MILANNLILSQIMECGLPFPSLGPKDTPTGPHLPSFA